MHCGHIRQLLIFFPVPSLIYTAYTARLIRLLMNCFSTIKLPPVSQCRTCKFSTKVVFGTGLSGFVFKMYICSFTPSLECQMLPLLAAEQCQKVAPNIPAPSLWERITRCRNPILANLALEGSTLGLCSGVLASILACFLTHKGFSEEDENGTCVSRFGKQPGVMELTTINGVLVLDPHRLMGFDGYLVEWCLIMGLTMLGGTLFVVSAFVVVDLYTWHILKHRVNTVAKQVGRVLAIGPFSVIIGYTYLGCAIIFSNKADVPRTCNYTSIVFGVSAYTLMVCHCYAILACVGFVFLSFLYGFYYPHHTGTLCQNITGENKENVQQ